MHRLAASASRRTVTSLGLSQWWTVFYPPITSYHHQSLSMIRFQSDGSSPQAKKRQANKAKKKKKPTASSTSTGSTPDLAGTARSRELQLVLNALDAPYKQEPTVSHEEQQRRCQIGRNYVIGRFQQHNDIDHDLTCKIHMKQHALKMIPKHYKAQAMSLEYEPVIDDDGTDTMKWDNGYPPSWRHIPVWTPPIPNFDPRQFVPRDEED